MLAFFPESSRHSDQLNGVLMGVANARFAADGSKPKRHDLLHALQTEIRSLEIRGIQQRRRSRPRKPKPSWRKGPGHLELVAESHPGSVVLHVLVDLDQGPQMVRALRGLRVVPYETSWAAAAQMTLAENLQHVEGALLGELQDQPTLKRKTSSAG